MKRIRPCQAAPASARDPVKATSLNPLVASPTGAGTVCGGGAGPMQHAVWFDRRWIGLWILITNLWFLGVRAEEFSISLDITVQDGSPGVGAGRINASTESDVYTFTATAGQLAFFDPVAQDATFKSPLRWQLFRPSGASLFNSFFSSPRGRTVLPEAGVYRLQVYQLNADPASIGAYSFRIFPIPPDQSFGTSIGETVSDGKPQAGAGRLEVAGSEDAYTFSATAGQLAFFEALDRDPALRTALRWQVIRPSGTQVFQTFFSNPVGRTLLNETGTYRVRVYTDGIDPSWSGAYSFRILPIPPDQSFPVNIGGTVSDGVPAPGAGRFEAAGTEDHYLLNATAGDLAFFEALNQGARFANSLRWQLLRPSGNTLFSSFFSSPVGRIRFPDTGQYRIRVYTDATDVDAFDSYSFRILPIPADSTFDYAIGTTVSDGSPTAGQGRLETAGAEDFYVFSGTAGQVIFFESLEQDPAFKLSLRWELLRPSGNPVFAGLFSANQGRTVLPETGTYRIRLFATSGDSARFGTYSFRTRGDILDQEFNLRVGEVVSDGKPQAGAGRIESPGSTDTYLVTGRAGQEFIVEALQQDATLKGALRWQMTRPGGGTVFSGLFTVGIGSVRLPEAGVYRIKVFTNPGNPDSFGGYAFRTYSPVTAHPDALATSPGQTLTLPASKLLFNDATDDPTDVLVLSLPLAKTRQGGSVALNGANLRYTPPAGFTGTDHFDYVIQGQFGGSHQATVSVAVLPNAGRLATVVGIVITGTGTADVCLLGDPQRTYVVESSADFEAWEPTGTVTTDATGTVLFKLAANPSRHHLFYRALRQ